MVPPRAHLPKGMPNHVTHEGLEALRKERRDLENQRADAGDNYVLCNFIDAKLKLLIDRINSAVEVDLSKADKNVVSFGAWVRYNDRTIRIVGVDEADFSKGHLSFISPIAKALIGKRIGDSFEIVVPKGKEKITVKEISFEPLELKGEKLKVETLKGVRPKVEKVRMPETSGTIETTETFETTETLETYRTPKSTLFVPEENIMEFLPVVNDRGNMVGRALFLDLHKGNKIMHPVVHLHITNRDGVTSKFWWHVTLGETAEKTVNRKINETLGISGIKPKLKKQYVRETKIEKELVYVFILVYDEPVLKTPDTKDYLELFSRD